MMFCHGGKKSHLLQCPTKKTGPAITMIQGKNQKNQLVATDFCIVTACWQSFTTLPQQLHYRVSHQRMNTKMIGVFHLIRCDGRCLLVGCSFTISRTLVIGPFYKVLPWFSAVTWVYIQLFLDQATYSWKLTASLHQQYPVPLSWFLPSGILPVLAVAHENQCHNTVIASH